MTRLLLPTTALLTLLAVAPHARAQAGGGESWLHPKPIAPGLWRGRAPYLHRHYEELQRLGIRTILNMRGNQPFASAIERRRAEAHGFVYREAPVGFRPLRDHSDEPALAAMQNVADYPLYVHCNIDRDRTSVIVAAYRVLNPEKLRYVE